jgi:subtilisin family serine protease/subtilisin-like proprotein convertase family protein
MLAEPSIAQGQSQFRFRLPHAATYLLEENEGRSVNSSNGPEWVRARAKGKGTNLVEFGSQVVLQLERAEDLDRLTAGHGLRLERTVAPNVFILQAPDALAAAREAHRLAALGEVLASYPVMRRQVDLHSPYAYQPSDTYFGLQWNLEHRNADGSSAGLDINAREAWALSTGKGVTIAVADTGVELTHVELARHATNAPHFNFAAQNTNGGPISGTASAAHGTEVAGLAVAGLNDARMVGVAPDAKLASWVIFTTNFLLTSDQHLMEMYQYQSNAVAVQNHSWGENGTALGGPTLLEQIGISNAISQGRSGKGVIMVRSCGNDRSVGANANDDGYPSDPRVIAVAAVRIDGRVSSSSEPGACILVGAPSGDAAENINGLFTTDLIGTLGVNQISFFPPDLSDYVFNALGFSGTSASAPQIAGIAALMLSANPNLTYRDVQQILILSSRHFNFADPDLVRNGAGLLVSHNDGFGVPDAGMAVNLARSWPNRPPMTNVTVTATNREVIPDDGLRVLVTGSGVPGNLSSIRCLPSVGPHADTPTRILPLVDFGDGTNAAGFNLTNKGALIQRDGVTFASQINLAAQVGAEFVVMYNYLTNSDPNGAPGGDQLLPMGGTDYVPIPAVFIGHSDGVALKALFQTNNNALAQIRLNSTSYVFTVTNTLICEHVGLRVKTDHQLRGDVRITLVSPMGTRSVLQRYNADESPGPVDWTYYSTHHFFESSAGNWTAYFSDEYAGATGTVQSVSLSIEGVQILDTDKDGLDDVWEIIHFACLNDGPKDDPDHDGYCNAREQIMGTDPNVAPFQANLSLWSPSLARLSFPGASNYIYEVSVATNINSPFSFVTNLPFRFPETEWFVPYSLGRQFFRVKPVPVP